MPPKAKTTKSDIIEAAFQLTKEKGFENVNARNIAARLGFSTHPLFRIYANMAELKIDLLDYINQYFGTYMISCLKDDSAFLEMGLAYVDFAKNEPYLFKMLFLSDNLDMKSFSELINQKEHGFILKDIPHSNALNKDKLEALFMNIWLFTHGIATMISTNTMAISQEEIKKLLENAFNAFSSLDY